MDSNNSRYSADSDNGFDSFLHRNFQQRQLQTSTPSNSMTIIIDEVDLDSISPSLDASIISSDGVSPRTPLQQNHRMDHLILSNYRLNHQGRKCSPRGDNTKLSPFANADVGNQFAASPRTPRAVPSIWKPLPSYRLGRLRHHLDAHRRPHYS